MVPRRPRRAAVALVAILTLTGQFAVPNVRSASVVPETTEPIVASQQRLPVTESVVPAAPADTGSWGPVMDWGIQAKHMAMLSTGRVLVWSTGDNARVWDPTTGSFTLTPATFGDLHCAGQTALADGRIIVVGGQAGSPHDGTNITALFDPVTETWTRGRDMTDLRWYATATTLPDGRVLASSGDAPDGSRSTVPEVYDPATNTWTRLTTASRSQLLYPFMFVLPNGRIYEAGSKNTTGLLNLTGSPSWSSGPTNSYSTSGYSESAVMYRPGKILRAGGGDPAQAATSVIDMTQASPVWRVGDPMENPRRRMNLTLLADGTAMAVGGTRAGDDVNQAVLAGEIWDPATEQWTTVAAMTEARMYHSTAVLLPDGRVLTGGGEGAGRLRAQIYSPPYLFRGARPSISSAPAAAGYGGSFTVATPDASTISSVALIRPSAATHALDMDQRYVPLSYSINAGSLTVSAPADPNVAPPGYYMLVLKNGAGVPSVASWIRIGSDASIQPGAVRGRVTDATSGAPVTNATVSSTAGTVVTDADGRYLLSNVPAGELRVTTSAAGYANDSRVATVAAGAETVLDIGLVAPGDVTGRVTDAASGGGIAGAAVGYPGGTVATDADGAYSITGLPAGSRTLSFGATGYASAERTVIVPAGGSVTQDVALNPVATFITGEVRSATSNDVLSSATVSVSPGALSATTDAFGRYRIDAAPGTYTATASAAGHTAASGSVLVTAGSYTTLDFSLTPTPVASETLTVPPVADTYVNSGSPTTSRATSTTLWSRGPSPRQNSYLRFTVSGVGSAGSAILRLYVTDASPDGGKLHRVADNAWSEGMLYAGQPTLGALISDLGAVSAGAYREIDVSSYVSGDGTYSFALIGESNDVARFSSREGANDPQLVVTPSSGGGGNASPACGALALTTAQDGPGDELAPSCTDADGQPLTHAIAAQGTKGVASVTAGGQLRYVPTAGKSGADSFTYTASDGTATSTPATVSVTITPTGGSGAPVTVTPVADTYVNSSSPTTSRATSTTLWTRDGSADQNSYLRFTVSGVGSASSAVLRLYVSDASPAGGRLHRVADNSWSEGMLYAGQPTLGTLISDLGSVSAGAHREIDVSAYVTGDGTYSFAIIGASNDVARFHSREGANDPQLVVTPAGGAATPPTAPVASFSVSPPSGPAPLAVTVSDSSTGSPSAWSWDFGDGSTATGATPAAHTFTGPGTFTISLTVSNAGGSSATTRTVTVSSSPPPPPSGSRIKDITFDAGLLDPVHGVDSTSGPIALDTAVPLSGTASASIAQAVAYLQESFNATDDLYVRFTVRLRSLPSGSPRIMMISTGGTTYANLVVLPTGRLRLRVGSTTVGVDSTPLVVGTTYYVGLHQRRGSGANAVVEAFVSTSPSPGTPFASTASGNLTTGADRVRLGGTNGTPVDLLLDDVLLDGGSMPMARDESNAMLAGLSLGPSAVMAEGHQH